MSLVQKLNEIEYPESDGKPMGETDIHIDWMIRIRDILRVRYRGQKVYTASNNLVYYQEGQPKKFIVPDNYVVLDCEPGRRRTFKIWEEGRSPDVVFEVTSRATRREDEKKKPEIYAKIGVREYFLYDPTAEYLKPPLKGFRFAKGQYGPIASSPDGSLESQCMGITLRLEEGKLVMRDADTGHVLPTEAEAERRALETEQQAREAEQQAREAEERAREVAESRAAELEAEVERLREELRKAKDD